MAIHRHNGKDYSHANDCPHCWREASDIQSAAIERLRAQLAEKERECERLRERGHLMATKIARALILIGPGPTTVDGRRFEYIGPRGTYDDIRRALENEDG